MWIDDYLKLNFKSFKNVNLYFQLLEKKKVGLECLWLFVHVLGFSSRLVQRSNCLPSQVSVLSGYSGRTLCFMIKPDWVTLKRLNLLAEYDKGPLMALRQCITVIVSIHGKTGLGLQAIFRLCGKTCCNLQKKLTYHMVPKS